MLQSFFKHSNDAVLVVLERTILYANDAAKSLSEVVVNQEINSFLTAFKVHRESADQESGLEIIDNLENFSLEDLEGGREALGNLLVVLHEQKQDSKEPRSYKIDL